MKSDILNSWSQKTKIPCTISRGKILSVLLSRTFKTFPNKGACNRDFCQHAPLLFRVEMKKKNGKVFLVKNRQNPTIEIL